MAKKRSTQQTIEIGIDIGYGNMKVVTADECFKFPSVAGQAKTVRFGADRLASKFPGEQISHDGTDWWVGNLALQNLRAEQQRRLKGRSNNNDAFGMSFRLLMVKSALAKVFPDIRNGDVVHVRIATGLPVNHMYQAAALKQALIGRHPIHTDTTNFVADIVDASVMPEPRGTMFAFTLKADGSLDDMYIHETTGVFNGGAVTNDVQFDRNGEFIDAYSGSSRTGHHLAVEELVKLMQSRFGDSPDIETIEQVIKNGAIRVQGKMTPLYDERDEALRPVRDGALQLLTDTIQTGMNVDCLIVSGGFALSSFEVIENQYPQAIKSDNPIFDTAQGYYNYSQFKWVANS